MAFSRTYPTSIIPPNPSDADFETNFRGNMSSFNGVVQDIDDEVTTGRGSVYANLNARFTALEGTAGVAASFFTIDSSASGSAGNTFFTTTGNTTARYFVGRAIRIISSTGTVYGYVGSSSFSGTTTVNIVTNAAGDALTISGTVTSIAFTTAGAEARDLIQYNQLSATATATLSGNAVAMAIALG